jgi:hypothetical protein
MTAQAAWSSVAMPLVVEVVAVVPVALWVLPWRQLQLVALVLMELKPVAEAVLPALKVFHYETKLSALIQG